MEEFFSPESRPADLTDRESAVISYDVLSQQPRLYRQRLMLILEHLPWNRQALHVEGDQVRPLVHYCADSENLYQIPQAEENIYSGTTMADDTSCILDALNRAVTNGIKRQIEPSEQVIRKRLLVWVDHFDQLLAAQAPQENGNPTNTDKHAA